MVRHIPLQLAKCSKKKQVLVNEIQKSCMVFVKDNFEREGHSHLPLCWSSCQKHGYDAVCHPKQNKATLGMVAWFKHSLVDDFLEHQPWTTHHLQTSITSDRKTPSGWSHCFDVHCQTYCLAARWTLWLNCYRIIWGHYINSYGRFKITTSFFISFKIKMFLDVHILKFFSTIFSLFFLHFPYSR